MSFHGLFKSLKNADVSGMNLGSSFNSFGAAARNDISPRVASVLPVKGSKWHAGDARGGGRCHSVGRKEYALVYVGLGGRLSPLPH